MLYSIAAVLVLAWVAALVTASAWCGLLQILLVVTIGLMVLQVFGGRRIAASRRKHHAGAAGVSHRFSH